MLTIHINKNANGLVSYFTNSLSKDDYFFSGESIPGRWHGALKNELGLPDKISRKDFSALAHNKHPKTGQRLTARQNKERRTSIEYTFAAPKSVSLIMALSDDVTGKQILNAHRLAVKRAMQAIEMDMQTQTTINGRKHYANTGKIIFGRFDHFSARPVKENFGELTRYVSDPHLHSHAVVMNVTKFGDKYQAIEGSTIHRVANFYQAIYHSSLSKSLQEIGFDIVRTPNRWEIKSPGMTKATLEKFSKRTAEIEKLAKKLGILNPKKKAALGAKIRVNKSKVKEDVDLKAVWRSRLTERERAAIQNAKTVQVRTNNSISPERAIDLALAHHLERQSAVPTKKLLAKALSYGYGQFTTEAVQKALARREDILKADKGYLEYLTTKEMVRQEDRMLDFAVRGKNTQPPINNEYTIQRDFLNDQQKAAIKQILSSQDHVQILSGAAGVGKSTLLIEIKEAAEQKGQSILAFATSSAASRDVLRDKGFKNADTIARFLRSKELQEQTKGQIILIDEASLVGVKTMNRILTIAQKNKARVILSGDARQHNSPEAGDAMRLLVQKAGLKSARVEKILRQNPNPKLKSAIEDLSQGRTRMGYNKLDKAGSVIEIEDTETRHLRIAQDYVRSLDHKRSALVIAPTHAEGKFITEAIRSRMKEHGRVQKQEKSFTIYKPLSYTAAQKRDHAQYAPGMVVRFHQNAKGGYKAGLSFEVQPHKESSTVMIKTQDQQRAIKLLPDHAERFEVYQKETIKIAHGDMIRITRNGRTHEKNKLYNGQVYRVQGFDEQGRIRIAEGRTLNKDFAHFTYGYVQTSHAAQGKDAQDVLVSQSSLSYGATNDKQLYVTASRARESLKIYTDDKEALRQAVSRKGERISAQEIAARHKRQDHIIRRNRNHYLEHHDQNSKPYERSRPHDQRRLYQSGQKAQEPKLQERPFE